MADLTDVQSAVRCVGTVHQILARSGEVKALRAALERAQALHIWLPDENVTHLLVQIHKLPSPPALYFRVVNELQSPSTSLENVGYLIERDPAMMAKILQMVNSTRFGLQRTILSPVEAVLMLGVERTKALILLAHSYSYFDAFVGRLFSIDELWQHSIVTGNIAQRLARWEHRDLLLQEEAYTAGLMHDLGKLALAANVPKVYAEAMSLARGQDLPEWEAEQAILGATHAEIGACLLTAWGLPVTVIEALALHHLPTRLFTRDFSPLTAVHLANAMAHALNDGNGELKVDREYLADLGLEGRMDQWWAACQQERMYLIDP
jgi:HD-like signal output (HDOD) protein